MPSFVLLNQNTTVRTETKIGNKTGNKFETELQKEILVNTYLVMLMLCNRIRNSWSQQT